MCAELVAISWTEDSGHIRSDMATLEDISTTGACLQLEQPIPAGTIVALYYPKGKYEGKVKYCKSQQTGYSLGIAFEPGYCWSKLDFQPEHLLEFSLSELDDLEAEAIKTYLN
jgi:hypothetical protein